MRFPCSTGEGARLVGTTEPKLADLVRRRRIKPEPEIVAGRRLWTPQLLLDAARALGLATLEVRRILEPLCRLSTAPAPETGGAS
jgi:hypothetical protein